MNVGIVIKLLKSVSRFSKQLRPNPSLSIGLKRSQAKRATFLFLTTKQPVGSPVHTDSVERPGLLKEETPETDLVSSDLQQPACADLCNLTTEC